MPHTDPKSDHRPEASHQQPVPDESDGQPAVANPSEAEYDRRGVLLPARARVGGIITPQ